jgi:redox-sensitive bicupin YhaK (pirin superfamily)
VIECRHLADLGYSDSGWLKAYHHFHMGGRGNPAHEALGNLYSWNDEELAPGTGLPVHMHRDVEILTYVCEGVIAHKDSAGGQGQINAGDVQVLSAGTGIEHAEVNTSEQRAKVVQIWLNPTTQGRPPRWATKTFPKAQGKGCFVVLASGFEKDVGAIPMRANARILRATLAVDETLTHELATQRKAYLMLVRGKISLNGAILEARGGARIEDESSIRISALEETEIILADVI